MPANNPVFEVNKLYLLESTLTNNPYVDEKGASHIFLYKEDADKDAEKYENVRISDPKYYTMKLMCKLCYSAGADSFTIFAGEDSETIPIREQDLEIAYYDHALNRTLALIKQHKLQKDLCQISLCEFLVPVQIRQDEDDIRIVYCVAKHTQPDIGILYLAFSNLNEFTIWSADHPGWSVICSNYKKLKNIRGNNGIMINPAGNRFIASAKMLNDIDKIVALAKINSNKERKAEKKEGEDK